MNNYTNLKIITNSTLENNEVRYNFETGVATIYAKTEAEVGKCIEDLEGRGFLKKGGEV